MDYYSFENKLYELSKIKNISFCSIGKTFHNRNIYCINVKNNSAKKVLLVGAIHAREFITCDLIMKIISSQYELFNCELYSVPLANPDGVELCKKGVCSLPVSERMRLIKINNYSEDFSLWKANARGVDINNNFDAGWDKVFPHRKMSESSQGFYGDKKESELETRAIINLCRKVKFDLVITLHTKGEEIYFEYFGKNIKRDRKIAEIFSEELGYKILNSELCSSGGLKDWCVQSLNIPALTIECGSDDEIHPIGEERLNFLYKKYKLFYNMINLSLEYV